MTPQQLAKQYSDLFVSKKRNNGDKFLCLDDSVMDTDPLYILVRECHIGMSPNDWSYEKIHEILCAIEDTDGENMYDIDIEPDVYNSCLLDWVQSNSDRLALCEQVTLESDHINGFIELIMQAQATEIDLIKQIIFNHLTA